MFLLFDSNHVITKKMLYLNDIAQNFVTRGLFSTESVAQRCPVKKNVLKNFTKFKGKYLCQSLFLNKVASFLYFLDKSLKTDKHC